MPRDGSGTFNRVRNWTEDAGNGLDILADRMDEDTDDIADEITNSWPRDGQASPTADMDMDGFKFTGLSAGSAAGHSVRFDQLLGGDTASGAAGLTLTNTSGRVQSWISTAASQALTLPDATTLAEGERFLIRNAGGSTNFAFDVKDDDGTALINLPVGCAVECVLRNNGSAAGAWELRGAGGSARRSLLVDGGAFGFRNLVLNGDMRIAQRGTQTSLGGTAAYTACDRFGIVVGGTPGGAFTASQDTDAPTGSGFETSLKIDCTTAEAAVADTEHIGLRQRIEAQTLQHLQYGAAGAKELVLSFWFKSPKSGTHCVALFQPDGTRSFVREFTVAAADAWEQFEVSFPGDASGTISNDTGAGLDIVWPLIAGANFQATADAWAASEDYATANQQNLLDADTNNIFLTGVQLEIGDSSTPFEHRPLHIEEELCRRYYERIGQAYSATWIAPATCKTTTEADCVVPYRTRKRATPTVTVQGISGSQWDVVSAAGASIAVTSLQAASPRVDNTYIEANVASGLAAGNATFLRSTNDAAYLEVSAEL